MAWNPLGAVNALGIGGNGGSQTVTMQVDPATQKYLDYIRQLALRQSGGAQAAYNPYVQAGNLGLGALTGQPGGVQAFMNPYQQTLNPFFQQQRQQAVEGANQQATLAGAFGGDRSQIGALLAGNQADQTQAAFQYQGFEDAR